jgi:hypothetical protein
MNAELQTLSLDNNFKFGGSRDELECIALISGEIIIFDRKLLRAHGT